jgi:hypothetical protein
LTYLNVFIAILPRRSFKRASRKVETQARAEAGRGRSDQTRVLRKLDTTQRRALELFERSQEVTAKEIGDLFGSQPRAATVLCQSWDEDVILIVSNFLKKSRRYLLAAEYEALAANSGPTTSLKAAAYLYRALGEIYPSHSFKSGLCLCKEG